MNKKFSTLVTAGLLIGGSLFNVDAKVVTPEEFLGAIVADSLDVAKLELPNGDLKVELNGDVDITKATTKADAPTTNGHLFIKRPGLIITKASDVEKVTFTGRFAITADDVTIEGLNIKHHVDVNTGSYSKTAIVVVAKSATITGNTIDCSAGGDKGVLANGITIFPTAEDGAYTVSGNTIKNSNTSQDKWTSCALQVVEDCDNPEGKESVTLKDFDVASISNNTFVNCAADYVYEEYNKSLYKAAQVTPIVAKDGTITNANYVKALANNSDNGKGMIFNGTAEQLATALKEYENVDNVAIQTKDGAVISGVQLLDKEINGIELYDYATSDYAMLVFKDSKGDNYAVKIEAQEDGSYVVVAEKGVTKANSRKAEYLWQIKKGSNADGTIWYRFESQNKNDDGKPVVTLGEGADAWEPVNNVEYNKQGVAFENVLTATTGTDEAVTSEVNYFGLYKAGNKLLTAGELSWYEMDGFSVTIKYEDPKTGNFTKEDIAGNPFVGHLTPMYFDGRKFHPAAADKVHAADTEFYLKNADGKYIVAQKYASNGSSLEQSTYTFTTISADDMSHEIVKKDGKYFGEFHAEVSAKYTDMQKLKAIDALCVWVKDKDYKNVVEHSIGRLDLGTDEVPTLAASKDTKLKPIVVALGSDDIVRPQDLLKKGKFYTVQVIENGIEKGYWSAAEEDEYGDQYNEYSSHIASKYGNELEVQWALTVSFNEKGEEDDVYVFTNREFKEGSRPDLMVRQLYKTAKADEYRYGDKIFRIRPVAEHAATDGYVTLDDLRNNKFNIGFSSNVFNSNAWFTENHNGTGNHTIGLDPDIENALEFTAIEYAAERKHEHRHAEGDPHDDIYTPTDSIYVISYLGYYDGNTYKEAPDTLKVVSYAFVNQYTEPLIYNGDESKLESVAYTYNTVADAAKYAQKFAIRKDYDKYNLRLAYFYHEETTNEKATMHQEFWYDNNKLYAGDASKGLVSVTNMYDRTENDLFVVEPKEKPMYRRVVNPLDTVSIFRNGNEKSVLFESKSFLAMENLAQYPEIAPGMLVDTAYVRNDTYRPQYMLVVGPTVHPAGKYCPVHGADAGCKDEHLKDVPAWVEGRYLVNLVDSAIAWNNGHKHAKGNPYVNSENYYRLGFVQATHRNDSLIIASDNYRHFVGNNDYNQAKFAFRYVDTEEGSFVIETADYKKLPGADKTEKVGEGWLKWMNGVVVVVDDIKDADIFNMNEEFVGNPTDNETIAASEVTVIAGEGQVTIAGAQGKKVVISNILGQVVANTVLTSDNATVAAPQGVVVVAVEGEEAVKAIVK